jgi:hypothetical protein
MNNNKLWEIYVPTMRKSGKHVRLRHHKVWDNKVRAITNGLTIFKPVIGYWDSPSGINYRERMIPVRIIATEEEINRIVDFTFKHYPDEEAILFIELSDKVFITRREK